MLRRSFNDGWQAAYHQDWFAKKKGEPQEVRLPHDAMIGTPREEENPYWFPYGGYRADDYIYTKKFDVPAEWQGRQIYVEFEGVYANAMVYLNEELVAKQPYGYSRFLADLSDYVKEGQNVLKVICHASAAPNSRWYPGSGIYRDVWLMVSERGFIHPWGVHVTTESVEEDSAILRTDAQIANNGSGRRELCLKQRVISPQGEVIAKAETPFQVMAGDTAKIRQQFALANPALWSPETPKLHCVEMELWEGEKLLDEARERFGIRTIQVDALHGLRINGKVYKLRGGCIHHDNGPIGAAEFPAAAKRRMRMMQKAGFNAVRASHNPISRALLDACDELGMLVLDESFDTWNHPKMIYDYHLFFTEWWEKDTHAMVEKDYNHPCVVMYSIGNEIPERDGSGDGGAWVRRQAELIRSIDPTRPITSAICNVGIPGEGGGERTHFTGKKGVDGIPRWRCTPENAEYFCEHSADYASGLDVAGMNYLHQTFATQAKRFPHRVICGTESMVCQYGEVWDEVMAHPSVIGDFCWTGWDYLGESGCGEIEYEGENGKQAGFTGSAPWFVAYCADFDLTGDRRTQSYYREIVWGLRKEPYIGVQRMHRHGKEPFYMQWSWSDTVASWTWPGWEGKETDVEVYANADEAELFINGVSQGKEPIREYRALWTVNYQPGTIEAVAYRNGVETGRFELKTVGKPAKLKLEAEALGTDGTWLAGGGDLAYVRVTAVDESGNRVYCAPEVKMAVEGAASLMGYGSGDPVTKHNFWEDSCPLFDGTAIAILRSGAEAGEVRITAEAEGFAPAEIELKTKQVKGKEIL